MCMDNELPDLIGQVIGGCRIDRKVGGGAMGAVYQGVHLALQKPVAVKIMSAKLAGDPQFVQRFLTEARLAAQIEHPNIVQVLNVGNAGPLHYIVMQLVEGESVAARIAREGALPWRDAARIALGVARGLGAAHAKNIIHRDIKPANILLTAQSEVKVADLGLAKAVALEQDTQLTQVGETMGTPQYMPPEQAADARTADARSDIYSLGCTLYHLLTGAAPFSGPTAVSVIQKHLVDPAPNPSAQHSGIPRALADLVVRMMAKQRGDRPQSMEEVAAALEQLLGAGPAGAARRPHMGLAVAAGAAAAVLLLLALAVLRHSPAQDLYEKAQAHWREDPADYEGAAREFDKVAEQFPGTSWAGKAEEAAATVRLEREQAAQGRFVQAEKHAQAAAQAHDYAQALKVWDDFPELLKLGEFAEKVRVARLKARLPVRVAGFMQALQTPERIAAALPYLEPEELAAKGREPVMFFMKLLRGAMALGWDMEGVEMKTLDFSPDLKTCNVTVAMKLVNKFNKQHEAKDSPQTWLLEKDEWYLQFKPADAR